MCELNLAYVIIKNEKLDADVLQSTEIQVLLSKLRRGQKEDMHKDNLPRIRLYLFSVSGLINLRNFLERHIWKLWVKTWVI